MKSTTRELIDRVENSSAANQAILILQGYVPKSDMEQQRLWLVRKILISMRDDATDPLNKVIEEIEK